MIKCFCSKPL